MRTRKVAVQFDFQVTMTIPEAQELFDELSSLYQVNHNIKLKEFIEALSKFLDSV